MMTKRSLSILLAVLMLAVTMPALAHEAMEHAVTPVEGLTAAADPLEALRQINFELQNL
jgi:predicted lipoprotein